MVEIDGNFIARLHFAVELRARSAVDGKLVVLEHRLYLGGSVVAQYFAHRREQRVVIAYCIGANVVGAAKTVFVVLLS